MDEIKKANKNDCLKAIFTELNTNSYFNATNLIKNPTMALIPLNDKNSDK